MNTAVTSSYNEKLEQAVTPEPVLAEPHLNVWTLRKSFFLFTLAALSTFLVLFLDVSLHLGAAVPVLYTAIVYLSAFYPGRWCIVATASVCSFFTLLGAYYSPSSQVLDWIILFNRGIALFVIWLTAVFLSGRRRTEDSLKILSNLASRTSNESFVCTIDGTITWSNAALQQSFPELDSRKREVFDLIKSSTATPSTLSELLPTLREGIGVTFEATRKGQEANWVQCDLEPIFDDFGNLKGAFGLLLDLTAMKREKERLQSYLSYTSAILRNIPEGIIVFDDTMLVDTVNQSARELLGFSREPGTENIHLSDILPPEVWEPLAKHFSSSDGTNSTGSMTFDAETRVADLSLALAPVKESAIGEDRYTLSITDITKYKEALRSLKSMNAELKQFAYVASHDLQEPLRKISSFLQILEEDYGSQLPEEARECIDFAVDGANRLQQLIQDLLTFTGLTRNNDQSLSEVDLNEVVSLVISDLDRIIEETGASIEFDALPIVLGREGQLQQVFQNLIENALKYCPTDRRPQIKISAKRKGRMHEIAVVDNGIGFDQQFAERIFRIFQRLHSKSEYSGTGIGLAICKRIIEQHGGRIWAVSESEKGSTFFLTVRSV